MPLGASSHPLNQGDTKREIIPEGAIKKPTAIAAAAWGITSIGLNKR